VKPCGGCAIVLRLQDRGTPAGAAPLRVAVLASLGHRPKPFFALAVLLRSKARGVPSVARPFTGQRVPRTLCNAPVHPWLGCSPGQQSAGRSPCSGAPTGLLSFSGAPTGHSPAAASPTGHSPDSGPPIGASAGLRLAQGGPVRAGKLPRALLLPRPYPCRLGARIPRLATVSDKIAQQGLGRGPCSWDSAGKDFSASSQSRCLHAR
jgi:hypothetical protein